jgi:hypothetical protein
MNKGILSYLDSEFPNLFIAVSHISCSRQILYETKRNRSSRCSLQMIFHGGSQKVFFGIAKSKKGDFIFWKYYDSVTREAKPSTYPSVHVTLSFCFIFIIFCASSSSSLLVSTGHSINPVNDRVMAIIACHISTSLNIARTPIGSRPLQDMKVSLSGRLFASIFVPIAPIGSRPLQDIEMSVKGCRAASITVPAAPIGSRPLQDMKVSVSGCTRASPCAPIAPIGSRPLQDMEVSVLGRHRASPCAPVTPIGSQPLQDMEVAVFGRRPTSHYVPRT